MSEEQPTFKVKDRRLFNPDGTPREVERDETPDSGSSSTSATSAAPPQSDAAKSNAASGTQTTATTSASTSAQTSEAREGSSPSSTPQSALDEERFQSAEDMETEEDVRMHEDVPGADDPASFINFLMSIASNAAAALGMMEHPVTGQRGVDLPLAKHWIDVLGMLQQKTRGNLAAQERQIFEGLLADLRLQYVTLTTPSAQPRGFTGRDIIGGK
ncbi:MAG TPA: DUF1844 domain-containing protein [Pyrinomonadaceae bacterium]|nr:DUF1844 domain-containing protein [Pyrinomonadaceae bacterium]